MCPILHFKAFSLKSLTRCERVNRYAYHKNDFTTIKLQIPDLQVMSLKTTWDFNILAFSKNEFYGQHEQVLYIMKIQSFDQGDSASNSCRQSRVEINMAQKRLGVEKKFQQWFIFEFNVFSTIVIYSGVLYIVSYQIHTWCLTS